MTWPTKNIAALSLPAPKSPTTFGFSATTSAIQPSGNLDVIASRNGRVVFLSENFGGFGKTLIVDHGDGLSTVYARNLAVFVKAGDNVQKGQLIARAGSAGRDKNVYLHFEVRKGYVSQNPYYYLP